MKARLKGFFKSSLIRKIILLFIVGTMVFVSLVYFTTRMIFKDKIHPRMNLHNYNYTQLVLSDVESISDTLQLSRVAEQQKLFIAIKNDSTLWKSNDEYDLVDLDELDEFGNNKDIWAGFDHGPHVVYKIDGTFLYFGFEKPKDGFSYYAELIMTINFLYFSLIIFIIFKIIQYILDPVNSLIDGVKKVSQGNFDDEIKTKRIDELGILINSYNDMSHKVANMIKSKEQLLLDVSHEMRSPLTRMKLSSEFIDEIKIKESILEDVNDLDKMITELLETERMNSSYGGLKKTKFNLIELLIDISMQYSTKKPGVKIDTEFTALDINADSERLRLLFKNLIENAIKYSENGDSPVLVNVKEDKTNYLLEINDRGVGIPADELEFIFEPFYRVDKSRTKESGGFGLGLHLCKNIVDAHGGNISVKSNVSEGTTFTIVLPK